MAQVSIDRITEIVKIHSQSVVRAAFAYVKNISDAEDITQEVFLTLMQKNPQLANEEHLKAWLLRVAINKSKNHLKSSWISKRASIPDNLSYMTHEQNELLQEVLALDTKYRIPLHLHYYEGYSIQEIGQILKMNPATVGTRLARGRQLLKHQIGGLDDES